MLNALRTNGGPYGTRVRHPRMALRIDVTQPTDDCRPIRTPTQPTTAPTDATDHRRCLRKFRPGKRGREKGATDAYTTYDGAYGRYETPAMPTETGAPTDSYTTYHRLCYTVSSLYNSYHL